MTLSLAIECDPARCPLCGESNLCARAADPNASACWCATEEFPRELLARVPEAAIARACICQRCLERQRDATGK
jgi:hypothetical protein